MSTPTWNSLVAAVKSHDPKVEFALGLSDQEIARVETRYTFTFPPDLRSFLQTALPLGHRFPDWRFGDEDELTEMLDAPRRGILFDIEHNGFWLPEWGPRPAALRDACAHVDELLRDAPKLIPVLGHRMMPAEPHAEGNPVFSVHQTDIIYYGFDLMDYFQHEFELPDRRPWPDSIRAIRFWDIDRFFDVRWSRGYCVFDNRDGTLP